MSEKADKLAALAHELEALTESPLYEYRQGKEYQPVLGEGDPDADILFIGEAPGKQEAQQGRPFVGAAGRILNELLALIELKRDDVYITNVVKDRPPGNRDPHKAEIELYAPLLQRQVEIIQPRVIATLGRFAMEFVLAQFGLDDAGHKISQVHGRQFEADAAYGPVTIVPLYHPAVTFYNQNQRQTLEEDFRVLEGLI